MSNGIIDQSIHCFLENSFLIAQNNIWSIYLFKLFKTIITINHATIKIVDIGCGIASAAQRHHRANSWWDNWNTYQKHPLWSNTSIDQPLDSANTFVHTRNFRRARML